LFQRKGLRRTKDVDDRVSRERGIHVRFLHLQTCVFSFHGRASATRDGFMERMSHRCFLLYKTNNVRRDRTIFLNEKNPTPLRLGWKDLSPHVYTACVSADRTVIFSRMQSRRNDCQVAVKRALIVAPINACLLVHVSGSSVLRE